MLSLKPKFVWYLVRPIWSVCLSLVSGFGRLYFWKGVKQSIAPWIFFLDLVMVLGAFGNIFGPSHPVGQTTYSQLRLLVEIGLPVYLVCVFTVATWVFGYVGPRFVTLTAHLLVSGVRFALCIFCLHWVSSGKRLGFIYEDALRGLQFLSTAAGLHLAGASWRCYRFIKDTSKELENPTNRLVHLDTGFTMTYLSLEEQKAQQQEARAQIIRPDLYMKVTGSYWYCPTARLDPHHVLLRQQTGISWIHRIACRLNARCSPQQYLRRRIDELPSIELNDLQLGTDEYNLRAKKLFCRCECCSDSDELESGSAQALAIQEHWDLLYRICNFRRSYLEFMDSRRNSALTEEPSTRPREPILHELCASCMLNCSSSHLISSFCGSTKIRLAGYFRDLLSLRPVTEESFLVYDRATSVRDSASNGCHLCNMIWNSLNQPQKEDLLARDRSSTARNTAPETEVYIKILSPHQNLWPEHNKSTIPKDALRVVPHFGPRTTARFWMEQKFVLRAHSLGRDPVVERHTDSVDPIMIYGAGVYSRATRPRIS